MEWTWNDFVILHYDYYLHIFNMHWKNVQVNAYSEYIKYYYFWHCLQPTKVYDDMNVFFRSWLFFLWSLYAFFSNGVWILTEISKKHDAHCTCDGLLFLACLHFESERFLFFQVHFPYASLYKYFQCWIPPFYHRL